MRVRVSACAWFYVWCGCGCAAQFLQCTFSPSLTRIPFPLHSSPPSSPCMHSTGRRRSYDPSFSRVRTERLGGLRIAPVTLSTLFTHYLVRCALTRTCLLAAVAALCAVHLPLSAHLHTCARHAVPWPALTRTCDWRVACGIDSLVCVFGRDVCYVCCSIKLLRAAGSR